MCENDYLWERLNGTNVSAEQSLTSRLRYFYHMALATVASFGVVRVPRPEYHEPDAGYVLLRLIL